LRAAPLHIAARRLARPEGWLYQWPGFYAETDFEGDTAWLQRAWPRHAEAVGGRCRTARHRRERRAFTGCKA
jgi:hypothetical protein